MDKNELNRNVIQDEFKVAFIKVNGKYGVSIHSGTNARDSRCLLKWAVVAAEMTNIIISDRLPTDLVECMKVFEIVITKASMVTY